VRIAIAQINTHVGAIESNTKKIISIAEEARDKEKCDLVIYPELAISGYPPEDLLFHHGMKKRVEKSIEYLKSKTKDIAICVGFPEHNKDYIHNSAAFIFDQQEIVRHRKLILPNYSVFDEQRYFKPGDKISVVNFMGLKIGILICEDIWEDGPFDLTCSQGADFLVAINGSPYQIDKSLLREKTLSSKAKKNGVPVIYVNMVGGQDELVFDGASFILNSDGKVIQRSNSFLEQIDYIEVEQNSGSIQFKANNISPEQSSIKSIYDALVLGTKDYVNKNNFKNVILGLSGGIDSALTLCVAYDALGGDRVETIMMPSRFTSEISLEDSRLQAENLNVNYKIISIEKIFQSSLDLLKDSFFGLKQDVTEENIQARCRGIILMALSNKMNSLLLTTGNKSEMAVGYATLYGDMAGGFAPLKDCSKTLVYKLANYRNTISSVIPERVISREPSAELRENQKDSDSLPDYKILDSILEEFIEKDSSVEQIENLGFDRQVVVRILELVKKNEYKRRQSPPGVRISKRAFGRDWRYPITSGY